MTTVVRVTRANVQAAAITDGAHGARRRLEARPVRRRAVLGAAAAVLVLAACGGGDDESATSTTPTLPATQPPLITDPPATLATLPPVETGPLPVTYVTEGATVMVVNASRIDGGAGRMSERLAAVGFQMVAPGNYTLGKIDVTKIYFDAANPSAKAVADSLQAGLGGGAIEVLELPVPPPVDSGTVNGAGVVVAMGNDTADKTLDELQGITPPATTAPPATDPADSTTPPTTTA
jgi:hypothetical protein